MLLDNVSVMPAFAFSLRRLREGYTGSCIRIRRQSDSTESDIGFSSTPDSNGDYWVDEAAINSFASGSNNAYVVKLYDQSTNAAHSTQSSTSKQALIKSGSTIYTKNGHPTLRFASRSYDTPRFSGASQAFTFFDVASVDVVTTGSSNFVLGADTATVNKGLYHEFGDSKYSLNVWNGSSYVKAYAGTGVSNNVMYIASSWHPSSGKYWSSINNYVGSAYTISGNTAGELSAYRLGDFPWGSASLGQNGYRSEYILFKADIGQSDRDKVTVSQSIAYGITIKQPQSGGDMLMMFGR